MQSRGFKKFVVGLPVCKQSRGLVKRMKVLKCGPSSLGTNCIKNAKDIALFRENTLVL